MWRLWAHKYGKCSGSKENPETSVCTLIYISGWLSILRLFSVSLPNMFGQCDGLFKACMSHFLQPHDQTFDGHHVTIPIKMTKKTPKILISIDWNYQQKPNQSRLTNILNFNLQSHNLFTVRGTQRGDLTQGTPQIPLHVNYSEKKKGAAGWRGGWWEEEGTLLNATQWPVYKSLVSFLTLCFFCGNCW